MYKMYLISAEEYENARVHFLRVQKTGEIWASMKNAQDGMGVKNMSDLVFKKIHGICGSKTLQKSKLKNTKWQKEEFLKNLII